MAISYAGYYSAEHFQFNGVVRVFQLDSQENNWIQRGQDVLGVEATRLFGSSLSLNGKGTIMAIGSIGSGAYYGYPGSTAVYKLVNSTWVPLGPAIIGSSNASQCGFSAALDYSGSHLAIGCPNSGNRQVGMAHVYSFDKNSSRWIPSGEPLIGESPFGSFGYAVHLSADGRTLAVGAPNSDSDRNQTSFVFDGAGPLNTGGKGQVNVYSKVGGAWTLKGRILRGFFDGDACGYNVKLSQDGSSVVYGIPGREMLQGVIRRASFLDNDWVVQSASLLDPGVLVGEIFAISADATKVVSCTGSFSAQDPGFARVYQDGNSSWTQLGQALNGGALCTVAISSAGNKIAVGTPSPTGNGQVTVFKYGR